MLYVSALGEFRSTITCTTGMVSNEYAYFLSLSFRPSIKPGQFFHSWVPLIGTSSIPADQLFHGFSESFAQEDGFRSGKPSPLGPFAAQLTSNAV